MSTKKKNVEAIATITITIIVARITSFLDGQVTFFTSCLTCLKNCIGLVFPIAQPFQ